MENIPPKTLLDIWKKGKTLYGSLFIFTAHQLLKKYNEQVSKLQNQDEIKYAKDATALNVLSGLSEIIFQRSQVENIENELKTDLINKILSEEIIGLGYEMPVKSSDSPKIIPIHIWPRKIKEIDWENSSVTQHGIIFKNIRLIKKSALKNKIPKNKKISLPKIKIEDKKTGRPSLKKKIISAYSELKKQGRINYSKPLKSHTELIQETVKILSPDIKTNAGMEHEAIRRAVGTMFKQDKNL